MNAPEKSHHETTVFISYSRKDKSFVQKLHTGIAAAGFKTWVDWEGIEMTSDWWREIQHGIEDADAFAFIISPDSIQSKVCNDEIQSAVNNNKRLIPIVYRELEPDSELHPKIASHNWVFMRDDAELETNLPQMLKVINTDLDWVRDHTRYQKRALRWQEKNRSNSFLLRGEDLIAAEAWLAQGSRHEEQQPTDLQIKYIQAGRTDETRRQRRLRTVGALIIIIFIGLTIFAFVQYLSADSARDTAVAAQATAEAEREIAEAQSTAAFLAQQEAQAQEAIASQNEELALTREAQAEEAQIVAETNEQLSNARLLVSEGESVFAEDPLLGLALVAEGIILADDLEQAGDVLGSSQGQVFQWGRQEKLGTRVGRAVYNPAANWLLFDYEVNRETEEENVPGKLLEATNFHTVTELSGDLFLWEPGPDQTTAVALYWDEPFELRDMANGDLITELPREVDSWLFSPDGGMLLVNYLDGPSELLDPAEGTVIAELEGVVGEAAFSADGRRLLALFESEEAADFEEGDAFGLEGQFDAVQLIDTSEGTAVAELPNELFSWGFNPNGNQLLLNYIGGFSELRDATDGSLITRIPGDVGRWSFSPDGERLFLSLLDEFGELRNTASGAVINQRFFDLVGWEFGPDGSLLLLDYFDAPGELRAATDGSLMAILPDDFDEHLGPPDAPLGPGIERAPGADPSWEFSPDGSLLLIDYFDAPGELRAATDGSLVSELPGTLLNWHFSPNEQLLLLNYEDSEDALAELRDATTGDLIMPFPEEVQRVESVFSPQENWLLLTYLDYPAELRQVVGGDAVIDLPKDAEHWSFSSDERWLFLTRKSGNSEIWNVEDGYMLAPLDANVSQTFFLTPTQTAVVRYQDGDIYRLNLPWLEAMYESDVLALTDDDSIRALIDLACQYPLADKAAYEASLQAYLDDFDIGTSQVCP